MAAKKTAKKSVKKTVTHDRLAVKAIWADGTEFSYSNSRSSERFAVSPSVGTEAFRKIAKWCRTGKKETNGEALDRIVALCELVSSANELADSFS